MISGKISGFFLLLICAATVGCGTSTPEPAPPPPVSTTMMPEQRGIIEQQRLMAATSPPSGFHEAMLAVSRKHDTICNKEGVEKGNEWLYQQLHGKTPEQVIAEWGAKP